MLVPTSAALLYWEVMARGGVLPSPRELLSCLRPSAGPMFCAFSLFDSFPRSPKSSCPSRLWGPSSEPPTLCTPPQEGTQCDSPNGGWGRGPRLREQLWGTQSPGATTCEPSQLPDTQLQRGQGSRRPAQWTSTVQRCPGDQGGPRTSPAGPEPFCPGPVSPLQMVAVPWLQVSTCHLHLQPSLCRSGFSRLAHLRAHIISGLLCHPHLGLCPSGYFPCS